MTTPFFPDVEQILSIVMQELPADVYARDRADDQDHDKRSVSSSELRAHAQMLAELYANLQSIDQDKFITTVTEQGLAKWEKELFSALQDSSFSYAQRQSRLLAKIRANGGISLPAIRNVIAGILDPVGLSFEILPYGGQFNGTQYGAWVLGFSKLGLDTYLSLLDPILGAGRGPGITPLDCSLDYAAAGLTAQQLADIQLTAYGYDVLIFGIADSVTLSTLDQQLTALEPARSKHIHIFNNAPGPVAPDVLDLGPFSADTLVDVVDCGRLSDPPATYDVWDFGGFV